MYRRNRFELFPERSSSSGYRDSEDAFHRAFENTEKLELVLIPTNTYFDRDIFQRMMPYHIHFLGLTDMPVLSEGFLRPGGKFFIHDVRHESARAFEKFRYLEHYRLTQKQQDAMISKMDQWQLELNARIAEVQNSDLKHAIVFFAFNQHHDRGWPLLPSTYLSEGH